MEVNDLLSLVEQCYEKLYRKKRTLFVYDSSNFCSSPSKALDAIRSYGMKSDVQTTEGFRSATCGILFGEVVTKSPFSESSVLLIALLSCRLFAYLRLFCNGGKLYFLDNRAVAHSLAVLKQWVADILAVPKVLRMGDRCVQVSIVRVVESVLSTNGLLTEECSAGLARILVMAALQNKRLYFFPNDIHREELFHCFTSSRGRLSDPSVLESVVLLPSSLALEAQLLLLDTNGQGGSILLFSCSLQMEGNALNTFVNLLRCLDVGFVASQRVLSCALKEALFDIGVVPLERLSLKYSAVVQVATGATPFHSLQEFLAWMQHTGSADPDSDAHIGKVQKIVVSDNDLVWLHGKEDVATVLVPVEDPVVHDVITKRCEQALQLARVALRGSSIQNPESLGACEVFFAEYLHHRFLLHEEKNVYLQDLVHVLRFTLLSHASYAGCTTKEFSHINFIELVANVVEGNSSYCRRREDNTRTRDTECVAPSADESDRRCSEELGRCAEVIRMAIDRVALLFRVKVL
ncbi:hypothetical protein DQ04_03751090 [Trypanosoma grayi]|uniref:hypothetical protein n=1 Tax=Trypanosoma grayi TaxID=71804 RepID=UPI0004F4B78F|nr:hypothetical protein DQ04_03751090 [Trypanosoma grayi]KEG10406.1 hypothetical protein DQ04_03751090 [Trypanosoma grayi]